MTTAHSPECEAARAAWRSCATNDRAWIVDRAWAADLAARRADVEAERCYVAYRDAVAAAARSCPACQERA